MPFPIDEKYIAQTEQQLGVIFPPRFKVKMIQMNGGEVIADDDVWKLFPFFDQSDKKRIKRTCNHIMVETRHNVQQLEDTVYRWSHETAALKVVAQHFDQLKQG